MMAVLLAKKITNMIAFTKQIDLFAIHSLKLKSLL